MVPRWSTSESVLVAQRRVRTAATAHRNQPQSHPDHDPEWFRGIDVFINGSWSPRSSWSVCTLQRPQPDVFHISAEIILHQNETVLLMYFNLEVIKWCIRVRSRSFEWRWIFDSEVIWSPTVPEIAPTQEGFIVYLSWRKQVHSDKLKVDSSISIGHRLIALLTKTLKIVTLESIMNGTVAWESARL